VQRGGAYLSPTTRKEFHEHTPHLHSGVVPRGQRVHAGHPGARHPAFVAPDAELFDARGYVIGQHGAGPVWQSNDGSKITGTVMARADAPRADTIPWLLLSARNTGPAGSFSKVTRIQRVNTAGGTAPSRPCTAEALGRKARVHYTADYRFFVQNSTR
jgi:uncharacterized protein DUF3455